MAERFDGIFKCQLRFESDESNHNISTLVVFNGNEGVDGLPQVLDVGAGIPLRDVEQIIKAPDAGRIICKFLPESMDPTSYMMLASAMMDKRDEVRMLDTSQWPQIEHILLYLVDNSNVEWPRHDIRHHIFEGINPQFYEYVHDFFIGIVIRRAEWDFEANLARAIAQSKVSHDVVPRTFRLNIHDFSYFRFSVE